MFAVIIRNNSPLNDSHCGAGILVLIKFVNNVLEMPPVFNH